jgi:hypothetical protein
MDSQDACLDSLRRIGEPTSAEQANEPMFADTEAKSNIITVMRPSPALPSLR